MRYGHVADHLIGAMSRVLHIRSAKHNTVGDLDRYFGLSPDEMFPEPPPVESPVVKRTAVDRLLRSSTVTWTSGHQVLCPKYRARHEGPYKRNLKAWMRWVRPARAQRKSALVYVHGWLEPGSWAEEATLFRKWGRDLEVDLAHVALPFHSSRKPRSSLFSGELFWTADLVRSVEGVRQSICDVRSAVAWLRDQGYEQVGVTGVSLGGAITMLIGCLDPAPDYIAPIVAHLQLGDAVEQAPILFRVKKDLQGWGYSETERRRLFSKLGWEDYEPVLAPDRQLWIQAEDDVYLHPEPARRQWRRWGEPNILWIDGGHMTFPLHIEAITHAIGNFRRGLTSRPGTG
jgi:pimeloyl-ACP methyl ester carboxylesterase